MSKRVPLAPVAHILKGVIVLPKLKTKRAARMRFKVTGGGKIMRRHSGARHLLTHKPRRRKRRLTQPVEVSRADRRRAKRMLLLGS